jgi:hypothetical protein
MFPETSISALRKISEEAVTVKLAGGVPPPTAPPKVTSPAEAVTLTEKAPSTAARLTLPAPVESVDVPARVRAPLTVIFCAAEVMLPSRLTGITGTEIPPVTVRSPVKSRPVVFVIDATFNVSPAPEAMVCEEEPLKVTVPVPLKVPAPPEFVMFPRTSRACVPMLKVPAFRVRFATPSPLPSVVVPVPSCVTLPMLAPAPRLRPWAPVPFRVKARAAGRLTELVTFPLTDSEERPVTGTVSKRILPVTLKFPDVTPPLTVTVEAVREGIPDRVRGPVYVCVPLVVIVHEAPKTAFPLTDKLPVMARVPLIAALPDRLMSPVPVSEAPPSIVRAASPIFPGRTGSLPDPPLVSGIITVSPAPGPVPGARGGVPAQFVSLFHEVSVFPFQV